MEIPKNKARSEFRSVKHLSFLNGPEGYAQIQYFVLQLSPGELFKLQYVKYAMITIIQIPVILHYFWIETSLKMPDEKWTEQGIAFLPADSEETFFLTL